MNKETKDLRVTKRFYYLKVMPHPTKDGVEGTEEKAIELKNALENFGLTVRLEFAYEMEM